MKSLIKVTCTAFLLTSLMAACSEQTTTKKEVTTQSKKSEKVSEENRMEKDALRYGEIAKGGYYRATVENAKYEKVDGIGRIVARVTINNARADEKAIDLSEIQYFVKDEKTGKKYEGQVMPMYEEKFKSVPAGYSLTFDASFKTENSPKNFNNMYLYMDSKLDPFGDIHWKLDNLVSK
ncbi:hypothetical protein [Bacillus pseudomycoides]|uniref:hypothetical protein n=1 Tax=Bacillus pseudomycoides TaxID=64104 RepID=UPI000BEB6FE7|nr:hypothetical protein [Bacillus pseudomycoides]PEE37431.1 hypothetical protein COO02_24035 [Bacillus pseudomycoides]PEI82945.1 hypothetical protein CN679_27190 [Bacillus pseudomycoides]PGA84980.1 hypothetical protein COL91_25495 [Bacillus pseudomycoides]PHF43137.1 hypothetical protein COF72_18350 [Bacillus pseudomycoides]